MKIAAPWLPSQFLRSRKGIGAVLKGKQGLFQQRMARTVYKRIKPHF
jgi:hypothetical protein